MKKYKLILFLSTALLSVACTDSFFDLEPSSSVPTDKVYKTAEDFSCDRMLLQIADTSFLFYRVLRISE